MAGITATFDICKVRDSIGREITPPPDFLSGFVRLAWAFLYHIDRDSFDTLLARHPAPFGCVIRPRSEKRAELVSPEGSVQEGSI